MSVLKGICETAIPLKDRPLLEHKGSSWQKIDEQHQFSTLDKLGNALPDIQSPLDLLTGDVFAKALALKECLHGHVVFIRISIRLPQTVTAICSSLAQRFLRSEQSSLLTLQHILLDCNSEMQCF